MKARTIGICFALLPLTSAAAGLQDLAWMAGDWRSGGSGESFQEVWLKPVEGFMTGVSRLYADRQVVMNEHLVIAEKDGDLVYSLRKHLRDDTGSLQARDPIVMRVVEVREGFVLFENVAPNPEEPRRLAYERNGSRMTVTVTDPPGAVTDQIGGTAGRELVFELRLAGNP